MRVAQPPLTTIHTCHPRPCPRRSPAMPCRAAKSLECFPLDLYNAAISESHLLYYDHTVLKATCQDNGTAHGRAMGMAL
jgi:hypothetical protein